MNSVNVRLSRIVSHALRHEPWLYELELDDQGWVPVDSLLTAIRGQDGLGQDLTRRDLSEMVQSATKRRHEMIGDRIRALYGHSVPGRINKTPARPPELLFHGTSEEAWAKISTTGLRPMGRQYVHLSVDAEMAEQVGRRKSAHPAIITVRAHRAADAGTAFLVGNERVWLAVTVPAEYLCCGD